MRCLECSTPIRPPRRRFCSKACSDNFYGNQLVSITCIGCGREGSVRRRDASVRRYCSRECYRDHYNSTFLAGSDNGRWLGGRALAYGPGWKKAKQLARERDRVCLDCGKSPQENGRALDVHHTDPFRFSGTHDLEKLRSLCRSCHMRNVDSGRKDSARFLRAAGVVVLESNKALRRRAAKERRVAADRRRKKRQEDARSLHEAGFSLREIARELGVSHQTVANWLRGLYQACELPLQLTLPLPA